MDEDDFRHLWDEFRSTNELKGFLLQCFLLFRTVLSSRSRSLSFPPSWRSMRLVLCQSILTLAQEFAKPLLSFFREEQSFDKHLWISFFSLCVTFLDFQVSDCEWIKRVNSEYGFYPGSQFGVHDRASTIPSVHEVWRPPAQDGLPNPVHLVPSWPFEKEFRTRYDEGSHVTYSLAMTSFPTQPSSDPCCK